MRHSVWILLLFMQIVMLLGRGDSAESYRLRTPTADDYIAALPDIIKEDDAQQLQPGEDLTAQLASLLPAEYVLRYGQTASPEQLQAFYQLFGDYGRYAPFSMFFPYLDPQNWHERIVTRWLDTHPVDLDTVGQLDFMGYHIDISPYSGNDGTRVWIMFIQMPDPLRSWSAYWFAREDSASPSGYMIRPLPVPFSDSSYSSMQEERDGAHLDERRDVNHDGEDELIFRDTHILPASWMSADATNFYVLGWSAGDFRVLTALNQQGEVRAAPLMLHHPTWFFLNIDDDPAEELIEIERNEDNWMCIHAERRVYDWDGRYYAQAVTHTGDVSSPTVNCALRDAESALAHEQYEMAVRAYDLTLTRYSRLASPDERTRQFAAYAAERRIVAYLYLNDLDGALRGINAHRTMPPETDTMASALIAAVDAGDTRPAVLCQSASHAVDASASRNAAQHNSGYRDLPELGSAGDDFDSYYVSDRAYGPLNGCDTRRLLENWLSHTLFSTTQSPIDLLQAFGIDANTLRFHHSDLNGDGRDEYWVNVPHGDLIFFLSHGDNYVLSKVETTYMQPSPSLDSAVTISYMLPNDAGQAWLSRTGESFVSRCILPDGSELADTPISHVVLWQLNGDQLIPSLDALICGGSDPFADEGASQLSLWQQTSVSGYGKTLFEARPTVFHWDAAQSRYVPLSNVYIQQMQQQENAAELFDTAANVFSSALYQGDWAGAAVSIPNLRTALDGVDDNRRFYGMYLIGMAYEFGGQPEEALHTYAELYAAAPTTPWGLLAALHLEPID